MRPEETIWQPEQKQLISRQILRLFKTDQIYIQHMIETQAEAFITTENQLFLIKEYVAIMNEC